MPHGGGVHGFETAECGRDDELPGRFRVFAGGRVDTTCGQLAGRDTGTADLALWRPGIVLESVQHDRALRTDKERGEEQAWQ